MNSPNDPSYSAPASDAAGGALGQPGTESSTAIEDRGIPLPPLTSAEKPATTPEQFASELRRLDLGIAGLVLVLAFILASFAVRNTDFWQHLAVGRMVAHGQYHFGQDPFTYMSTGYWANQAWLFDLLLYGIARVTGGPESAVGGALLVILKALLVTALAWVMLKIRRPGFRLWASAACTGIALVAMSPRLLMQPTLVSFLFLGLTLYWLQRPTNESAPGQRRGWKRYWLLPVLFALWANLDSWFLLGPITVALYLLGQVVQRFINPVHTGPDAPEPREPLTLLGVLVIGTTACLLNPHHYHVFTLPAEISPGTPTDVLDRDFLLRRLVLNSLDSDYVQSTEGGAFYLLLGLGCLSFGLSIGSEWRWWRFLIWGAYAALALYQQRCVPFFTVVAAPITALNFQDFALRRHGILPRMDRGWRAWSLGGRVATLLIGVLLLALAWPGWLHSAATDVWQGGLSSLRPRNRVGWAVEVDSSLRLAAERVKEWHKQGLIADDAHGFNYAPDISNYFAWFCADDQGRPLTQQFLDYRFPQFPAATIAEYVDARQTLLLSPQASRDLAGKQTPWQDIFRRAGVNYLVLNGSDPVTMQVWSQRLRDWQAWPLLYIDGRTSIFRWNNPRERSTTAKVKVPRLDLNQLAFGPHPEKAPSRGIDRAPQQQDLWTRFLHGPPPRPADSELAIYYLRDYMIMNAVWPSSYLAAEDWANWTGMLGTHNVGPGTGAALLASTYLSSTLPTMIAFRDSRALQYMLLGKALGPPAAPLLAIRAARRGIAQSPDDAQTYITLAQTYAQLWHSQEDQWGGRFPTQDLFPRQVLHQIQATTALEHALKLRPDDWDAHITLYGTYLQSGYQDLALDHLRAAIAALSAAKPLTPEERDQNKQLLERWNRDVKALDTQVTRLTNEYNLAAENQLRRVKVQIALSKKLGKKALDLLLEADETEIGPAEGALQLELLISTGRPAEALEKLTVEVREAMETAGLGSAIEWLTVLIGGALGNYEMAGQYLDQAIARQERATTQTLLLLLQTQSFHTTNPMNIRTLGSVYEGQRKLGDFRVLRGILALEQGQNAEAVRYFRRALEMAGPDGIDFESRRVAMHYAELLAQAGGDQ